MLTVLMSLYNKEKSDYLNSCLESLKMQSLQASEIIIVFDGPINEELIAIVDFWKTELPINEVILDFNVGLAAALNFGLKFCSNEFVARMDTDDICHPERLKVQLDYMIKNPNVDICGSYAKNIDEYGCVISERTVPTASKDILRLIWSCPIIHPSVIFKKSKILSIGSYRVDAPYRQDDYDLWIRSAKAGLVFSNIPMFLLFYRFPFGAENKNTIRVGFERLKLGFPAVLEFDFRFFSIAAMLFPLLRPLLPRYIQRLISNFDPR